MEKKPSHMIGRSNKERKEDAAKRKVLFLATYEEWGTVKKACEVSGISRRTYREWAYSDYAFSGNLAESKKAFGEALEEIALERVKNPDKGRGSDVLLLGLLNANMSEKYRPTMALNEDSAREVITELRKISREKRTDGPVEEKEEKKELSDPYKKQLVELLEKKGNASQQREEPEDDQPEHSDA
jgi:hypothetical protein